MDTHADRHVGAALDQVGRLLGTRAVPSTAAGHAALLAWARGFGTVERVGIEGTGSYGAGLSRWLRASGVAVVEVERPKRPADRGRGKSDPVDAEAAARAVLAGTATARPKAGTGAVEGIRALQAARRSAMKARTQAANQLRALVITAPDDLRARLRRLGLAGLVATATAFRPRTAGTPAAATKLALKSIAVRYRRLTAEVAALDAHLGRLVAETAPELVAIKGIGTDTAAALLVTAGDNPERLRSEGAFARLCGVAPIPASSGKTVRHRLNRGGDQVRGGRGDQPAQVGVERRDLVGQPPVPDRDRLQGQLGRRGRCGRGARPGQVVGDLETRPEVRWAPAYCLAPRFR